MAKNLAPHSCFFFFHLFLILSSCRGEDRIPLSASIKHGQNLTSSGGTFVLGFFSPAGSSKSYLGIWFSVDDKAVVWVANRENPLDNSSGILLLDSTGDLVLTDASNRIFWSTGRSSSSPVSAVLLDSGNFVLIQENNSAENYLWQSFEYPTDTLLPGMKVGPDKTGRDRNLTSWTSERDPSRGQYTFKLNTEGVVQPFLVNSSRIIYRSGPWNGINFSGNQAMKSYRNYTFRVVQNEEETYYQYWVTQTSILPRLVVEPSGELKRFQWDFNSRDWQELWSAPTDSKCDYYAFCGPNAFCNGEASLCKCFGGFTEKNPDEWIIRKWNNGCARRTMLSCGDGDDFFKAADVKLPDTVNSTANMDLSIGECRERCLNDCSCVAYSCANISSGSGCILWFGDLIDVRTFAGSGQDFFIRISKNDADFQEMKESKKKNILVIGGAVAAALASVFLILLVYWASRKKTNRNIITVVADGNGPTEGNNELAQFDFSTIVLATDNFALCNKIGSGGIGDVYKGVLRDGQIVAVKKISFKYGERIHEFMTEVRLIAKFQHRNLVRLLGCCTEAGEGLLVYEYVPNRSLDFFIFGKGEMRQWLGWEKRLTVIMGVARGLLYLHQDSRLRVIHRDLKAANILLEEDMNPKISDFGTARIFQRDQLEDNTIKVVGTLGYMSPEYMMNGNFSEKSDVFSFGVLVLEIISGRRNKWISPMNHRMELLSNAWTICAENQIHALLDNTVSHPTQLDDIFRCAQVGLLCVQESPEKRPTMQEIVLMLANKNTTLSQPERPGFFQPTSLSAASFWFTSGNDSLSTELGVTFTALEGR